MKKLLFAFCFVFGFAPTVGYAAEATTGRILIEVQRQLAEVNKKLDLTLEGQKRLSEEHSQIKKWIHKR